MNTSKKSDKELRRRAEALLRDRSHAPRTDADQQRLMQELEVHQIELELQNEELQRAHRDLERVRDRYFDLYDLAPVGYMTLDAEGRVVETNLTATSMLGVPRAQLTGAPLSRYMISRESDRFQLHLRDVFGDTDERSIELELLRPDGGAKPVVLTSRAIGGLENRLCRSVFVDLSAERKLQAELANREAELRESLLRFRQLVEAIDDVFYVAEADTGRLLYVSPAYAEVFGRPAPGPTDDQGWLRYVHADDRPRVATARARLADGTRMDLQYRILRPDAQTRLVRDRAFPTGRRERVAGIVRDLTEERRLQDMLQQTRRMEAIGTLTSGIAHDFNNLLMGIAGGIDIALERLEPRHEARAAVVRARQAAMRGADLVQRLLDFSRTRTQAPEIVELDAVATESRHLLGPLLGEHIDVILELGAPGRCVLAAASDLEQVLVNLAVNARDAMPEGGTLRIRTEDGHGAAGEPEPQRQVVLSMSDTGVGMDEETRRRVFEPFYTTKAPGKGTGLGLSSVYAVVRRLGGVIAIDSAPGAGTTITVALPVVEAEAPTPVAYEEAPRGAGTILLVEDDELIKTTVSFYLEALGYTVLGVSHPKDAVRAVERHGAPVDLVVTDVMLPGMLGNQLAAELQRHWPGVPVLFISAHARETLVREGRLPPDGALLQKPFDRHTLGRAVADALQPSPAATTAAPGPSTNPRRILVVDDDESTLELLQELLELKGHDVASATNVEDALERARAFGPDLVLSDLSLGGEQNGLDLARAIRSDETLRHARLVALTGYSLPEHRQRARDAGFDGFLTKPLAPGDLERLLET